MFKKYQHLERFGTDEVSQIELGECYIFPKLDGTNSSIWMEDGEIKAGSRTRELSLEKDNAGFYEWAIKQDNIKSLLLQYPNFRLFGEWLVPHSLKTYREDAWRKFYVFDVSIDKQENEILHDSDDKVNYMPFDEYMPILQSFGIEAIRPICKIKNGSYEQLIEQLKKNVFLIEDGKGCGEGIVIKNYEFKNRFNRQTWAKIVTSEFKEHHAKEMGAPMVEGKKMIEEEIVNKYVTKALCEKILSKIKNEYGFSSKQIPQLLNTVYYDLIKEDCWNFIKENGNPTLNFKTLQHFTYKKVKEQIPILF